MAKYLMAMDAGTGSVRAVIFSTEGEQVGCVQKEWTHNEDPRWPGSMDFDWTTNWELARTCVSEVLAKTGIDASDIAAVSTTCMREGILLYDKDGKAKELTVNNTNRFLKGDFNAPENITVIGGKTGTTNAAGHCLILLSRDVNGAPYISVILNSSASDVLYPEMVQLLEQINK